MCSQLSRGCIMGDHGEGTYALALQRRIWRNVGVVLGRSEPGKFPQGGRACRGGAVLWRAPDAVRH